MQHRNGFRNADDNPGRSHTQSAGWYKESPGTEEWLCNNGTCDDPDSHWQPILIHFKTVDIQSA